MEPVRISPLVYAAILGLVAAVALLQTARIAVRAAAMRRRLRRMRERGRAGEARGERLLVAAGYAVLGRQVAAFYRLLVDGKPVEVGVRADFIVERRGRRYVAEVKTGELAPRVSAIPTRRQLLEYRIAFNGLGVTGTLLIDAEAERILLVEVAGATPSDRGIRFPWALAALALLGLGVWLARDAEPKLQSVPDETRAARPSLSRKAVP